MAKIDIISGFLGAGKTTLIKKLLSEALKGQQVVLIENEFGEIGIDGGFLKDAGVNITEMNSGCICCSLVGDFGTALKDHEMPRYGYSTRQSGPPPRDHITEYRPAICRGNAMGNTNLWRFFMPCRGYAKLYEYGWEIPCFFACGRRKRGRP